MQEEPKETRDQLSQRVSNYEAFIATLDPKRDEQTISDLGNKARQLRLRISELNPPETQLSNLFAAITRKEDHVLQLELQIKEL